MIVLGVIEHQIKILQKHQRSLVGNILDQHSKVIF